MKMQRNVSRLLTVTLLLSAVLILGGCSWFHKKAKLASQTESIPSSLDNPTGGSAAYPADRANLGPGADAGLFPLGTVDTIYFDYDKATVRRDQASRLEQNVNYLKAHASDKVLIIGHCDERGSVEYNLSLGQRRADMMKEYLIQHGIGGERLSTLSKGEEEPADPGHNDAAWRKNRRAEFHRLN